MGNLFKEEGVDSSKSPEIHQGGQAAAVSSLSIAKKSNQINFDELLVESDSLKSDEDSFHAPKGKDAASN